MYVLKGWSEFEYEGKALSVLRPAHVSINLQTSDTESWATALTSKCGKSSCQRALPQRKSPPCKVSVVMEKGISAAACFANEVPFAHVTNTQWQARLGNAGG